MQVLVNALINKAVHQELRACFSRSCPNSSMYDQMTAQPMDAPTTVTSLRSSCKQGAGGNVQKVLLCNAIG